MEITARMVVSSQELLHGMSTALITLILDFGNLILASVNVVLGFALLLYIFTHNRRSPVARAFAALITFVTIVYLVDVAMSEVGTPVAASIWLRLQWFGIAFVPAAYLHFSDSLLRTTGSMSRVRRAGVVAGYVIGLVALVLAVSTDVIVNGLGVEEGIFHLLAGPGFPVFVAYYVLTALGGWLNISRARARTLTPTSRRRMSYLTLAFLAPSLGVFPFLLIPTLASFLSPTLLSALTLLGNIGIALMTVVIAYIVAYQGVLLPDRVIKHNLIHYLLRGPLVASLVIGIMLAIPHVERILGLPRDLVMIVSTAGAVVILQVAINLAKPAIDRLIYRSDRTEVAWIQRLDERLLTSHDLEQVLENTLIALCDLLRAPSGFVVTLQSATPAIRVFCGPREAAQHFMDNTSMPRLLEALAESRRDEFVANEDLVPADGHWLLPLRGRRDEATLGILGIRAGGAAPAFTDDDLETVYGLVRRAELALEDMQLQKEVFAALRALDRELDEIQEWRAQSVYPARQPSSFDVSPVNAPGFAQAVKDALTHYWGGPKLSQSALLRLELVRRRLDRHDHVPAKALRAALSEAIERLRPAGERHLTASEWLVYNILDLRFVQGQRIRDIARRLAISESDYYRKQRIAIEQVSETLAAMERDETDHHAPA
jgi:hypothetical protein